MTSRPIIGITTSGREEVHVPSRHYDAFFSSPALYVDAVRRAGGFPVLLPPGETDWQDALNLVDGIIVTGGGDINPELYNGDTQHKNLVRIDTERDASELALIQKIVETNEQPVLCICRGMQVLNVAFGGTMYEHIPDIQETDIHRNGDGLWTVQEVAVEPDTLLAEVMQTEEVATYSGHHQAVKDIAPGMKIVATAADGIVEALEYGDHPWLLAVQWHPEITAANDPSQQRLFDRLVQEAAVRRNFKLHNVR